MGTSFLGIIPARYDSTRFPGKPLALLGGKPMIRWVWEKASTVFTHLVVATDDQRIKEAVEGFGGIVLMTSVKHRTGTERCAEALELYRQQHEADITHVVNIQGDEPLLKTEQLESLRACFTDGDTEIATLIQPLVDEDALANPNVVKVTVDKSFRALYFSRAPIPFMRDTPQGNHQHTFYSHIGLYAYQANVLRDLVQLPVSPLEKAELLEQLRWLENGYTIRTRITEHPSVGVDTPEDLEAIRNMI